MLTQALSSASSPELPPSFYELHDGLFFPTALTIGPWSRLHQHGGPPAGLMTRAIEHLPTPQPMQLVRMTVELYRPISLSPFSIDVSIVRPGKKMLTARAELWQEGNLSALASAMLLRKTDLGELPSHGRPFDPLPPPGECLGLVFPFFTDDIAYHQAIEMRLAKGTFGRGDLSVWMRVRVPLLQGEPISPWQRVMVLTDAGSGVSAAFPLTEFRFLNSDLNVQLNRMPEADWLGVDAHTQGESSGVGLSQAELSDGQGRLGRSLQSLFLERLGLPDTLPRR